MSRPPKAPLSTDRSEGESMAISVLTFLAEDASRVERFLSVTGLRPGALREAAASPGFLRGVLEYLVGNEPLLVQFAAEAGLDPGEVVRALERLEGPRPLGEP